MSAVCSPPLACDRRMEKAEKDIPAGPLRPLQPGARAPDFTLPAINREGAISLADFRGRCGVLLGLFRGFDCPFCRRQITQLGVAHDKLRGAGVETLAIIVTPVARAALYIKYRPTPVVLLSDPDLATHQAFGLPRVEVVLGGPGRNAPGPAIAGEGDDSEGTDAGPVVAHGNQLAGHFLIDSVGIVRWTHVEGAEVAGAASHFPGERELLEAARSLGP